MNKTELVAKIAEGAELTKVQAEKVLDIFIASTTAALKAGDKVAIIGFGAFSAVTRKARTGRNPQTGKALQIAEKTNGKFTPGKALKDLTAKPVKSKSAKPTKLESAKPIKLESAKPTKLKSAIKKK
ncbi:histone family protein DNA-binding protein [Pelobacter propionicus DSM 2379]|uniref:Histone family protein DNA-binding protein n=1 Tax=Pelobacter propionicus (strain DSM 2379 / NBRC 103807 / OttBd1) TaxID=338966 RepID=A1AQ83_PELPD|nr:histone family protein DNA-binding protein [Pelobacter propionicus DSM 2379]